MASACVNNIGVPPENFLSMGWLSPRISFSRGEDSKISKSTVDKSLDLESSDFEFRGLDDPAIMLPADQLFSDGKLVPLHLSRPLQPIFSTTPTTTNTTTTGCRRSCDSNILNDPYLFSPKAPRCSSRWRELLGLKKSSSPTTTTTTTTTTTLNTISSTSGKSSIRQFLQRNSKGSSSLSSSSSTSSSSDSLHLPLLVECDSSLQSIPSSSSSRLSLSSSSSSGHDYDDLPRLSLDAEKPNNSYNTNPRRSTSRPRMRLVRPKMVPAETTKQADRDHPGRIGRSPMRRAQQDPHPRGVSVDSPRMNPSGRVVFQSLERSSSSPSSFNGGPRHKHRGMERSYSANVRITPVLNVPVCSLRGGSKSGVFRQLFSSSSVTCQSQKKEGGGGSNNGGSASSRNHYHNHRRKESS